MLASPAPAGQSYELRVCLSSVPSAHHRYAATPASVSTSPLAVTTVGPASLADEPHSQREALPDAIACGAHGDGERMEEKPDSFPFLTGSLSSSSFNSSPYAAGTPARSLRTSSLALPTTSSAEKITSFLADGRSSIRDAMRLFLRQNHLFHSDEEIETFISSHRILIRKQGSAGVPSSRQRLFHSTRSQLNYGNAEEEEEREHGVFGEGGALWMDYDRSVATYALRDDDVLEFRNVWKGSSSTRIKHDDELSVKFHYKCDIPWHEMKHLVRSAAPRQLCTDDIIGTICFPTSHSFAANGRAHREDDLFHEKPPQCWAALHLDPTDEARTVILGESQSLSFSVLTEKAFLSIGTESLSIPSSVLGVHDGFQRCRVLIYEKRLYKSLVFSANIHVWEALQFLTDSLLRESRGHHRKQRSSSHEARRSNDAANYALYITSLKKALALNPRESERAIFTSDRRKTGFEEAKPFSKLISYRLKDKHILVLMRPTSVRDPHHANRARILSMDLAASARDRKFSELGIDDSAVLGRSRSVYIVKAPREQRESSRSRSRSPPSASSVPLFPPAAAAVGDVAAEPSSPTVSIPLLSPSHFIVLFPERKTYRHFYLPPNTAISALKRLVAESFLFSASSLPSQASPASPQTESPNLDTRLQGSIASEYSLFVPFRPHDFSFTQRHSIQLTSDSDTSDFSEAITSEEESEESEGEDPLAPSKVDKKSPAYDMRDASSDYEEGLWLEEDESRTLGSYCLSDAQFVIEFKKTPQRKRMILIDGFNNAVLACCRLRQNQKKFSARQQDGLTTSSKSSLGMIFKVVTFSDQVTVGELQEYLKMAFGVVSTKQVQHTCEEEHEEDIEDWGVYLWRSNTSKGTWLPDGQQPLGSLGIAWTVSRHAASAISAIATNAAIQDRFELRRRANQADLSIALAEFSMPLEPILLEGEKILQRADQVVHYLPPKGKTSGRLYLTNYQLIFLSYDKSSYEDLVTQSDTYIPFGTITKAFKMPEQNDLQYLQILCKDMRNSLFGFKTQKSFLKAIGIDRTHPIIPAIISLAHPKSIEDTFAFLYKPVLTHTSGAASDLVDGWGVYSPLKEYQRLGLVPSHYFRFFDKNKDYSLCPTYPAQFVIPAAISDDELRAIAAFRSKGRVPAVVWRHKTNGATITRCSQPMVGNLLVNNFNTTSGNSTLVPTQSRRCTEDEKLAQTLRMVNDHNELVFIDARPLVNAVANSFKRGGSEDCLNVYKGCQQEFMGIGNVHVIRESWKKLQDICNGPLTDHFYVMLATSRWLDNISQVLSAATRIAEYVHKRNASIIIHCTDGWDRTPQLSALAQLLLDPYYRTIVGFEVLIEKEWISFGHQFTERCAHVGPAKNETPIFTLFIDCVWQVMQQYPLSFEFNERFLITILDEHYNCKFGTFLVNSEREMKENNLEGRTVSLWTYINSKQHKKRFKNILYKAQEKAMFHKPHTPFTSSSANGHGHQQEESFRYDEDDNYIDEDQETRRGQTVRNLEEEGGRVLFPRTSVRRLKLWETFYMRWSGDSAERENEERDAAVARLYHENKRLRRRLKRNQLSSSKHDEYRHAGEEPIRNHHNTDQAEDEDQDAVTRMLRQSLT